VSVVVLLVVVDTLSVIVIARVTITIFIVTFPIIIGVFGVSILIARLISTASRVLNLFGFNICPQKLQQAPFLAPALLELLGCGLATPPLHSGNAVVELVTLGVYFTFLATQICRPGPRALSERRSKFPADGVVLARLSGRLQGFQDWAKLIDVRLKRFQLEAEFGNGTPYVRSK
jgi:hypothetical protein